MNTIENYISFMILTTFYFHSQIVISTIKMTTTDIYINRFIIDFVVFIFITIIYYVKRWFQLRQFKKSWLKTFSKIWFANMIFFDRFHSILMKKQQKYDTLFENTKKHIWFILKSLMRIQSNVLLIDDFEIITFINVVKNKHVKIDWYTFMRFNFFIDNIFLNAIFWFMINSKWLWFLHMSQKIMSNWSKSSQIMLTNLSNISMHDWLILTNFVNWILTKSRNFTFLI